MPASPLFYLSSYGADHGGYVLARIPDISTSRINLALLDSGDFPRLSLMRCAGVIEGGKTHFELARPNTGKKARMCEVMEIFSFRPPPPRASRKLQYSEERHGEGHGQRISQKKFFPSVPLSSLHFVPPRSKYVHRHLLSCALCLAVSRSTSLLSEARPFRLRSRGGNRSRRSGTAR